MRAACLLALWAGCFTQASFAADPFLQGMVTDEEGRPIAGASVTVHDCIGTCLGGKTVLTGADGRYIFETKPFRNSPLLDVSMPGRYKVSQSQTGPALFEDATDTPRQADFVLGTPAAATVRITATVPEGWKQRIEVRPGRSAKVHRYPERGTEVSGWKYWDFPLLPRNEDSHLVIVREEIPPASLDDVPADKKRREHPKQIEIISAPFVLVDPQRYDIRASLIEDEKTGTPRLVIDSIKDALWEDRTKDLVKADPMFGSPVDAATREQALALLTRVSEVARPWNSKPAKEIASYQYDAVMKDGEKTHVERDQNSSFGPSWNDISRIRGFAYMPPLRWLFSQPDNVEFLGVDIGDETSVLHYRLKEGRGFSAGVGVGPSWNGFFSRGFSAGQLTIDTRSATVREHRMSNGPLGEESIETFTNYVPLADGMVPQELRLQSGNFDIHFDFQIHDDILWLLKEAKHRDNEEPGLKIENVVVTRAE